MRGEVLHYDEAQGFGFITGSDGNRYTFRREDLRRAFPLSKGMQIEFRESGGQARDIFSVGSEAMAATTTAAAALAKTAAPYPQHFGRLAVNDPPASTGLWSYFWEGITRNYANFRGRARRKEYWGYVLFVILGGFALGAVGGIINVAVGDDVPDEMSITTIALVGIFCLAMIVPSVAVGVRRIHDIGLSGWFYLLFFIPYLGWVIMLVFALIPSQKHENK